MTHAIVEDVADSGEKHALTVDIDPALIDEALRSVERHSRTSATRGQDAEVAGLKAELERSQGQGRELLQKLQAENERAQKAQSDLEQFKKRAAKERQESETYGLERFVRELLPVIDNLERAVAVAKATSDIEGLVSGVAMTQRLLEDALGRQGVKPIRALGQGFDPNFHEAISQRETSEAPPNTVVEETSRGYTYNERLVRPSMVIVAKSPNAPNPASVKPANTERT